MAFAGRRETGSLHLRRPCDSVGITSSDLKQFTHTARSLELVVWLVPSLIGGAVAVSLVGVLLGPFYPIAMNHAGRILPRWLLTGCIGWIAGFGCVIPFRDYIVSSWHFITVRSGGLCYPPVHYWCDRIQGWHQESPTSVRTNLGSLPLPHSLTHVSFDNTGWFR
jgi:hypothetical protein